MTTDETRQTVLRLLTQIAPELDPAQIDGKANLRDQLDVDSMDLLNFMISLHKTFAVEIPERDYRKLMTIDGCVDYIEKRRQEPFPGKLA
jgi:acyl carrier protein